MTIHVATSTDIGRAVRRTLRLPAHFVPDNLLVGPSAPEAEPHREARASYWEFDKRERTRFDTSFRALLQAMRSRARMVVWTSRLYSDVVALWSLTAFRLLHRPLDPKIDLAVVGHASDNAFGRGSIGVKGADIRNGLDSARPLSLAQARRLASFWRRFTGRPPILASSTGRGARGREDLAAIGSYQAGFFPRVSGVSLSLSRVDHLLLSCVGDDWATPADVFMRRGAAGDALREWASHTGDVFIATRLRAWAEHEGGEAPLHREPHRPDRLLLEARYKLSAAGEKILRDGLGDVAQGVPLPVGGATAYDPLAPWVVVEDSATGSSLRRLGKAGRAV
jgi:hypothetical protein